jgi:hypothetical protein
MPSGLDTATKGRCCVVGNTSQAGSKVVLRPHKVFDIFSRGEGLTFDRDKQGFGVEMVDLTRTDRV